MSAAQGGPHSLAWAAASCLTCAPWLVEGLRGQRGQCWVLALHIFIGAYPLMCCGKPAFDLIDIFVDCFRESCALVLRGALRPARPAGAAAGRPSEPRVA